jgi:hypothetical protein
VCKSLIPHRLPPRSINVNAQCKDLPAGSRVAWDTLVAFHSGLSAQALQEETNHQGQWLHGAVQSDMPMFISFIKLMLAYHAWCHYLTDLPPDLQEDLDLNCFSRSMVIQYFDAII